MLHAICTISLIENCVHFDSYSIVAYFVNKINYTFSLGGYLENSSVGGYSFDCIKSMAKFFEFEKLVP